MTTPMLPAQPDCGAPCAMCESYAHLLAKAREELESVRKGSATVCRELREEIARLRADKERLDWLEGVAQEGGFQCSGLEDSDLLDFEFSNHDNQTSESVRAAIDAAKGGAK